MRLPQGGGCQCGAVRYEISGPPRVVYACHCTECQRQSGAAFALAAVALASVATPFLGMVESSILIRPYVMLLTRSELCMVMCTGLATIAGTVLVIYSALLAPVIPNSASHLLIASNLHVLSL